jgi:hypothetical protein
MLASKVSECVGKNPRSTEGALSGLNGRRGWILDGKVMQYKFGLVAQGSLQVPGIYLEETPTQLSRLLAAQPPPILLTLATPNDLEIHQVEVEGAYLKGKLDVELVCGSPRE